MIVDFEDFRSIAENTDLGIGIGSIFKSQRPANLMAMETIDGLTTARSFGQRLDQCLIADLSTVKKLAVRFDLSQINTSFINSFGFSTSEFNAGSAQTSASFAPFLMETMSHTLYPGYSMVRLSHVILASTGTSVNTLIVAESAPFMMPVNEVSRFDFSVEISDADIVMMKVAKDGLQIVSGDVSAARSASTRQARTIERANLAPASSRMSNVVFYVPDAEHPFPLRDLRLDRNNAVSANLASGKANDGTFETFASSAFENIPLAGGIPADAQIMAAKAVFRHTAGGGNAPAYPEFAIDFQDGTIGQIVARPVPEAVAIGAPANVLAIRPQAPLTAALINGARLRARSRIPPV